MLCQQCGVREATTRMTAIDMGSGQPPSTVPVCAVCAEAIASRFRPTLNLPQLEEWAALAEREGTEAECAEMADWLVGHAERAGAALSPPLRAFVERHGRPPA